MSQRSALWIVFQSSQVHLKSSACVSVEGQEVNGGIQVVKKKLDEKALIPLPPTGLVSFFCAIPDVVQTNLQPRRAVGLCSRSAIAQNAKF